MQKVPPPERLSAWRVIGWASFAIGVALFLFIGSRAGMRWFGVVTLAAGAVQVVQRRIAYGWEGREPSGYITGVPAVLLGLLIGALGLAMLAKPDFMLVLLGWNDQ
jgi:uncharacterized membrane protein YfcA